MTFSNFDKSFKKLNNEQKRAVLAIEGPVMVMAGPGTGKTQVLSLRIANILLKTDTPPDGILAITFTEAGAAAMRERLIDIIGAASAQKVNIYTYHGLARALIKNNPDMFPEIIGSRNATALDRVDIVRAILKIFPNLRPIGDANYYVKEIMESISILKRENVTPVLFLRQSTKQLKKTMRASDFRHRTGKYRGKIKGVYLSIIKILKRNIELAKVYRLYQIELRKRKLIDFEDMILEAVRVLDVKEDYRRIIQEKYLYILADEHQDSNNSQNKLLHLLADFHENPNLFVVGDINQAIYGFQGAGINNFDDFMRRYKNASLLELTKNYRSHDSILYHATGLASGRTLQRAHKLSVDKHDEKMVLRKYPDSRSEIISVVNKAVSATKEKGLQRSVANLFRNNSDVKPIISELEKRNVSYSCLSDRSIFDDENIKYFMALIKAAAKYGDEEHLIEALHAPYLALPPLDIYSLIRGSREKRKNIYSIMGDKQSLIECGISEHEKIINIHSMLVAARRKSTITSIFEIMEELMIKSGILTYAASHTKFLDALKLFFSEITRLFGNTDNISLNDFIQKIYYADKYGILTSARDNHDAPITLSTAHRAKGREYDYVFIVGLDNDKWGGNKTSRLFNLQLGKFDTKSLDNTIADERKLLYVAITRAKEKVFLSFSESAEDGREKFPSQLIEELRIKNTSLEKTVNIAYPILGSPSNDAQRRSVENNYLTAIFLNDGLSPTALGNFLTCPLKYLYVSLLRIPEARSEYQMYGSVIHKTLREYFEKYKSGENADKSYLLSLFLRNIGNSPLFDSKLLIKKGKQALLGYFRQYGGKWNRNIVCEYYINKIELSIDNKVVIKLNGVIDKIESCDGGVVVVDYKTGKPRSRNSIMGNNIAGDKKYYDQLVFYKLLVESEGKLGNVLSCEIDFIEPIGGKYRKENFVISDDDVEKLRKVIIQTTQDINDLSFLTQGCKKIDCKYCALWTASRGGISQQLQLSPEAMLR